jgi:fumarate hydratase class II
MERDSMGEFQVPSEMLYGAQTARAAQNFRISGVRFPRSMIRALGAIKLAAARVNAELGLLDPQLAGWIEQAAREVMEGALDAHFVLDVYQTGSGTSTNMNANEVIANRAIQLAGGVVGSKHPVHPNDHVNRSQSSNDSIPTALHIAASLELEELLSALDKMHRRLLAKAAEWDGIVKIGRTHLMDATPIRLGQEVSGWARMVELGVSRLASAKPRLYELAQGGTAVGTGLNAHPEFGRRMAAQLSSLFGLPFTEAANHFEAQGSQDAAVELAGLLATVASSLFKIANDIRWLSSGPRCGLGELQLPAVQPGSSIMPGKVNPVMCEALMMVCVQVIGNAQVVAVANTHGNLDLNVMLPVIARNLLESLAYLSRAVTAFDERALAGLSAHRERAESLVEWSMSMVTSLVPEIGYDRAAEIAKQAVAQGKTVREVCLAEGLLSPERLAELLDPAGMTEPGLGAGGE